jgi:hypothetical protein
MSREDCKLTALGEHIHRHIASHPCEAKLHTCMSLWKQTMASSVRHISRSTAAARFALDPAVALPTRAEVRDHQPWGSVQSGNTTVKTRQPAPSGLLSKLRVSLKLTCLMLVESCQRGEDMSSVRSMSDASRPCC